jgi:hypothetical protein
MPSRTEARRSRVPEGSFLSSESGDRGDAAVDRRWRSDPGRLDLVEQRAQALPPTILVEHRRAVRRCLEPLDRGAQLRRGAPAPRDADDARESPQGHTPRSALFAVRRPRRRAGGELPEAALGKEARRQPGRLLPHTSDRTIELIDAAGMLAMTTLSREVVGLRSQ